MSDDKIMPEPIQKQGQIPTALSELEFAIERLSNSLTELYIKISPTLRPGSVKSYESMLPNRVEGLTELTQAVLRITDRIEGIKHEAEEIKILIEL